jgi:PAS domain S-box-containing protein
LLVEATPSAIVMIDERGNVALTNARAQQLFAYPAGELLGRPVDVLGPTRFRSDRSATRADCFSTPAEHTAARRSELFGLRKDGSEVAIEIGLNPITTTTCSRFHGSDARRWRERR